MSFKAVWGFDPDDKTHAINAPGEKLEAPNGGYSAREEELARIPLGVWAQIYELKRMFER